MENQREQLPPFKIKGTSFPRTCFNGLNALSGIGLITIPYTLAKSGWLSLGFLVIMAIVTCYTGILIKKCMDSNPTIKTFPEIGQVAFGRKGKLIISTFMYLELYLVPTGFLILEADNLHKLFPHAGFRIGGHFIGGTKFFTMISGLAILPSMWLKDLSWLSFVSATGVMSSCVIIFCVFWVGAFDGVGFSRRGDLFRLSGLPTSLSLYAFCFGGHAVFPTLYSSMKDKSKFSKVLLITFSLSAMSYVCIGIFGYLMFGQDAQSQVTLNLPTSKISSKIAIYTILAGPIAKYALIMSPISNAIEDHLPNHYNVRPISILIRTLLLLSSVMVALLFPFFGSLVALVGAILNVTVSIQLPCVCYLKISKFRQKWGLEVVIIGLLMVLACLIGGLGTYSSVRDVIGHV